MNDPLYRVYENTPFNDKYRLTQFLGSGQFGAVFLADEIIGDQRVRSVALKAIRGDRAQLDQIVQELRLAVNVDHPHLIRCFTVEIGSLHHEAVPVPPIECRGLVMEVADESLGRYIARYIAQHGRRRLPVDEVRTIAQAIADALVYLHQQDPPVVHQDLKPDNILRARNTWKLADFGVSRSLSHASVTYSRALGTLPYAAPEVIERGAISAAWDVWSLGILITELLTGQHPFSATTEHEFKAKVLSDAPQISHTLPGDWQQVVLGCLTKERKQRWTAQQVLAALTPRPVAPTVPSSPTVERAPQPPPPVPAHHRRQAVAPPVPSAPAVGDPPQPTPAYPTFEFEVVTVNDRGEIAQRETRRAGYWREDLGQGVTLDLVRIPGGTFRMGSPKSEKGRDDDEGPQHKVTVPEFWLGKYAVTQAQWRAVAALPQVARKLDPNPSRFKGAQRPVEQVSGHDAMEFCARLSKHTGRSYRLPSEAEWEYVCRAGTTTPFHFGPTITPDLANYDGNCTYGNGSKGKYRGQTTDVGRFPANGFGLYDMHGNVWEWCQDNWHDTYQGAPPDGSAWTTGGDDRMRIRRGGSWFSYPWDCRSAYRLDDSPGIRYGTFGFRVACSAPGRS